MRASSFVNRGGVSRNAPVKRDSAAPTEALALQLAEAEEVAKADPDCAMRESAQQKAEAHPVGKLAVSESEAPDEIGAVGAPVKRDSAAPTEALALQLAEAEEVAQADPDCAMGEPAQQKAEAHPVGKLAVSKSVAPNEVGADAVQPRHSEISDASAPVKRESAALTEALALQLAEAEEVAKADPDCAMGEPAQQ